MNGDCLELMRDIPDGSVDLILTDLPYGTTACKWDTVIDLDAMWFELKRITKSGGTIALFCSQPFTSLLISSNLSMYKYNWIWDKKIPSGMSYARYQPMRRSEDIAIFCDGKTEYNPQMVKRDKPIKGGGMSKGETTNNSKLKALKKTYTHKNPTNILEFDKVRRGALHPTQKPVNLLEYLIKTYTQDGDVVADITCGSGSTGVAAINTGRKFIGIELDPDYFKIAEQRINDAMVTT